MEQLRDAAAEGRIDLDELDERLERALTAKTYAELDALTADLPRPPAPADLPSLEVKGGLQGASRGPGRWDVPAHVIARGGLGGVKLDFSRAECRLPEVTVEAYGEAAGVTIVVPDGWAADTGALDPGIGGLKDTTTPDRLPGTPDPRHRLGRHGGRGRPPPEPLGAAETGERPGTRLAAARRAPDPAGEASDEHGVDQPGQGHADGEDQRAQPGERVLGGRRHRHGEEAERAAAMRGQMPANPGSGDSSTAYRKVPRAAATTAT